ncbi:MAG: ERF family protein [Eubacteriales bacterium]|nr:ERF family protein [Eubacteriales bacterium]
MSNNLLTLQEKMVKIRSEIPALVKRAYSEDVSYDFTKIDDIYRYLTPAMNRWKVNLDIVSEKATKKREDGTPNYLEFLNYCQMWLYEADLELQWINAENPEESSTVTIHAIGTHEMPEKAKGSAWTYAIKYYLLDKFCIDQGGEDPDMRSFPPDTYDGADAEYDEGQPGMYGFDSRSAAETAGAVAKADVEPEEGSTEYLDEDGEQEETAQDGAYEMEEASETDGAGEADTGKKEPDSTGQTPVKAENKNASARPAPSRHIMPESGKMVSLPNGMNPQPDANMSVEEAENVICTFGIYNNQRLGDLMDQGQEGIKALEWIAFEYRGRKEQIRQAARVLLSELKAA